MSAYTIRMRVFFLGKWHEVEHELPEAQFATIERDPQGFARQLDRSFVEAMAEAVGAHVMAEVKP